jgi:hypothetical protein
MVKINLKNKNDKYLKIKGILKLDLDLVESMRRFQGH